MKSLVDKLDEHKAEALEFLRTAKGYDEAVEWLVKLNEDMDPERITIIDHGDYQGFRVYVVGGEGYQPSRHYYTRLGYGSCSGCDAWEAAEGWGEEDRDLEALYAILHDIASGFREMYTGDETR